MKTETSKIILLLLLFPCCICFMFGSVMAYRAGQDREFSYKNFKIEVLNKENIEKDSSRAIIEFEYKVTNNSDHSMDQLNGEFRISNLRDELLTTGRVTLTADPALKEGTSSQWTVSTKVTGSNDAALELWNLSCSELKIEFRVTSIYFTGGEYRSFNDESEYMVVNQPSTTDGSTSSNGHTHVYKVRSTDTKFLAYAAHCKGAAKYYYSCACGVKSTQTFSSGPLGDHLMSTNKCLYCGLPQSSSGLEYKLNAGGETYTVTGIGDCRDTNIVIGIYNNLNVTGIEDGAFDGCKSITSVTIGDCVTSIGDYAFKGCSSLASVTISDSVTDIGDYAFFGGSKIASIKYGGTESQWGTISKGTRWDEYLYLGSYYEIGYNITYNYTE